MDTLVASQYRKDTSDTKRALALHIVSGERWVVEYCSLWEGDQVVPEFACIIASVGPLHSSDLPVNSTPVSNDELKAVYDAIDAYPNLTDKDAEWLQAEDEAGKIIFPLGAR